MVKDDEAAVPQDGKHEEPPRGEDENEDEDEELEYPIDFEGHISSCDLNFDEDEEKEGDVEEEVTDQEAIKDGEPDTEKEAEKEKEDEMVKDDEAAVPRDGKHEEPPRGEDENEDEDEELEYPIDFEGHIKLAKQMSLVVKDVDILAREIRENIPQSIQEHTDHIKLHRRELSMTPRLALN
ncbi:hypothetical protein Dimus_007941 [Dionaea muscipula]